MVMAEEIIEELEEDRDERRKALDEQEKDHIISEAMYNTTRPKARRVKREKSEAIGRRRKRFFDFLLHADDKKTQTGAFHIAPKPKRGVDYERRARKRAVKRALRKPSQTYPGTPQNNTTIKCSKCGDTRDAEILGGGWTQCNTCGVKMR